MAVTLTNSLEGVTPSGTVLTGGSGGNTGGVSGSFFDTVNTGSGATTVSDSAQNRGTLSVKLATSATSATTYLVWGASLTGSSLTTVWARMYLYMTAYPPSGSWRLMQWTAVSLAAALQIQSSTGQIRSINTSSATINTSTMGLPLNQWVRIEAFCTGSATVGQVEFRIYSTNPDAPLGSYDEIQTSAATQNTSGALTNIRFGPSLAVANFGPAWFDDLGCSDTAYVGPAVTAQPYWVQAPRRSWVPLARASYW